MYTILKNLINKKYYPTAEAAQENVDVAWAMNRITDEQAQELTELVNKKYGVVK